MPKSSRARRVKNEINAGSMADIAFLLLIFFLVTTTIVEEQGILVKLPPLDNFQDNPYDINQNNVFTVKINESNQILAENNIMDISSLKDAAKEFIINPNKLNNRPQSPNRALVSLQNDRGTEYKTYLMVYNELRAAYRELRETEAQKRYGLSFDALNFEKKKEIRNYIPLVISEAEPTEF